jgi:hypothetical protein
MLSKQLSIVSLVYLIIAVCMFSVEWSTRYRLPSCFELLWFDCSIQLIHRRAFEYSNVERCGQLLESVTAFLCFVII